MAETSKYQKFETDVINRSEIRGAEYNPRVISEDARKRLRKMIAKHGLVQPLVWNRRTGNLVAGHQRLAALDSLERSQDYDLQVAVVDVSEREERVLNVQLNNPSMQGEWDLDKLTTLAEDAAIAPDEFGFSDGDIAVLFGEERVLNVQLNNPSMQGEWDLDKLTTLAEDAAIAPDEFGFSDGDIAVLFGEERLDELMSDTPEVAEAKNSLREIKEHRAESMAKMQEAQSADFYFTVVCESDAQKKAVLKALGVPDWESFVNGRLVAGRLGV